MNQPPLLNIDSVELETWGPGGHYAAKLGSIASEIGAQKLGYRLVLLEPGKTGWPAHAHYVNEEMFFILEGEGTLVLAGEHYPLRSGDVIAIPPNPDTPHQIINSSMQALRYLAVSTMEEPDIIDYPASGKLGVFAGSAPGGPKEQRTLRRFFRHADEVDYWEDEQS
jgi:uncharacterized cupin superfamily protein